MIRTLTIICEGARLSPHIITPHPHQQKPNVPTRPERAEAGPESSHGADAHPNDVHDGMPNLLFNAHELFYDDDASQSRCSE